MAELILVAIAWAAGLCFGWVTGYVMRGRSERKWDQEKDSGNDG